MMKKEYKKPTFYVIKIEQTRMICDSDPEPGGGNSRRDDWDN